MDWVQKRNNLKVKIIENSEIPCHVKEPKLKLETNLEL